MLTSLEKLIHFQCDHCQKWWSIGDAPIEEKKEWFCPWCGEKNKVDSDKVLVMIFKSKEAYGMVDKYCGDDWKIVKETEATMTIECSKESGNILTNGNIYAVYVED